MAFQITGLDPAPFHSLFMLDDAQLQRHGIDRHIAQSDNGYPCRVSLSDAGAGEELLLLSFEHMPAPGPYQAAGPIYVRRSAQTAAVFKDVVPEMLAKRLLSVRAYDGSDRMVAADVSDGAALADLIARFLADDAVAYLHVHIARRGCFAARVDRA